MDIVQAIQGQGAGGWQFGRLIGELACMTDEQLDLRVPSGRSAREVVAHVLESLESFFVQQIRQAKPAPAGA